LESQFGVTFAADAEASLFSVRDVVSLVEKAREKQTVAPARRGRASRHFWERTPVQQDQLEDALKQTPVRTCARGVFELGTQAILASYLRVSCTGLEHVPQSGPFILASNHCSHLDSAAIRKVLGKRAATLHVMAAKDYFFDTPLKSWFFKACLNALPLDREEHATESLAICKAVLERGRAILIYPEGTRSVTGELQAFKSGIGVLAVELDYPLIPVCLRGTHEAWPKGRRIPRRGRIEVHFGPALDVSRLKAARDTVAAKDLYRAAAAELRAKVEALGERSNAP
jgi:long-chain acyl-CoA synthetase